MGISMGLEAIFRWMHVLAGILWVGLLYFFNFVNGPFLGKIDANTRKIVVPELMPRALVWSVVFLFNPSVPLLLPR